MTRYNKSKGQLTKELETLAQIYKHEQEGKLTREQIAEAVGVSVPTLKNLKSRHARIWAEIEKRGVSSGDVKMGWLKDEEMSLLFYNPEFNESNLAEMFDATIDAITEHSPSYAKVKVAKPEGDHCIVLHPTDMHIGKEGSDGIEEQVLKIYKDTMGMASVFDIEQVILTSGGDMLQIDTPHGTTTKGTHVETDGSSLTEMFDRALKFYVALIDLLAKDKPVHFVNVMANHDYAAGLFLAKTLEAWYRNHPNVTFDVTDEMRKYVQYGDTMLAFDHGFKVRENDLATTIATEAYEMWGTTKYRYAFIGHLHTNKRIVYKSAQEVTGLQIEWLKAVAKPDKWHRDQGYLNTPAVQSFVFSKDRGEVARYNQHVV